MLKRTFDITSAAMVLIVLFPVLVITAIAIKLTSPGPVFYGARRAGLNGAPIRVWKFRTMVTGADKHASVTIGSDARITRIGKLLRATKLDEIPQLWNILCGQMSVVGPRPESLDIVEQHFTARERETLAVLPGLTCPGNLLYYVFHEDLQPPAGQSANDFYVAHLLRPKLLADLHYVQHRSFGTDIELIIDTIRVILAKWQNRTPHWTPIFAETPPENWQGTLFRGEKEQTK
ncbi:MAG: lipopolysaccharide/colanic/teichoic acid biosynthesis glycosyltransferase [Verrucomicrobiales bacterium]|jgi:lipopolysaccharide/colanic/teichoic acid biosynthesis glycosyltransferase